MKSLSIVWLRGLTMGSSVVVAFSCGSASSEPDPTIPAVTPALPSPALPLPSPALPLPSSALPSGPAPTVDGPRVPEVPASAVVDAPPVVVEPAPAVVATMQAPVMRPIGPDGYPMQCLEDVALSPDASGRAGVELSLQVGEAPFVFGEENPLADGASILATNLRFYLSQFQLTRGQARTAALPVSEAGEPLPYGVHLVNAEDPASLRFHLAAPPGDYDGVRFLVGLAEGCNSIFSPLAPPLDQASQMKWPHVLGFLFLRFEGKLSEGSDSDLAETIHMGRAAGDTGFAPAFEVATPITLGAPAGALGLRVDVAEILEAASFPTDLSDFELPPPSPPLGEEILAGERLRRNEPQLRIFHLQ